MLDVSPATLAISFDHYLDPTTAQGDALVLLTGGRPLAGRTQLDPLTNTLIFHPASPLTPGLTFELHVNDAVAGFGTEPVAVAAWRFTLQPNAQPATPPEPARPTWDEHIAALLHDSCGCHNDGDAPPTQLTRGTLEIGDATGRTRRFVAPGDPARSYLLHKVLPNYPDRFGTAMPPPWSDVPPLTEEQLRMLSDWILAGSP